MLNRIVRLIQKALGREELSITIDTDLVGETGINSLELVELVSAFEEEFDVRVPDKDIRRFRFISDIVKYLEEKAVKV